MLPRKASNLARHCLVFCACISLLACASYPPTPIENPAEAKETNINDTEVAIMPLSLTPELMYYILAAETASQRNKLTSAADLYYRASMLTESATIAGRSAQAALLSRDNQRISRALDRWLEVEPTNGDIYVMQTPLLILRGDDGALIEAINTSLNLAPNKARDYLNHIAANFSSLMESDRALSVLQRLDSYKNNDLEALLAYARLATLFKRYEPALPAIDLVLKQAPKREEAYMLKADILQQQGKDNEAIAVLKKIATKKTASKDVRFAYAASLGENNHIDQARVAFTALQKQFPDSVDIIYALGMLALKEKDGKTAKQHFSRIVTKDPDKQVSYLMGLAEEIDNNLDNALVWFASVPADSNRFEEAQSRYINLLADSGQVGKARLHLQLMRDRQSEQTTRYYLLEAALLAEYGEYYAAFNLYTEALSRYPDDSNLLYGRAMIAERLNRLAILEDDFRTIIKQNPNHHRALNALGYTLTDRTNRHKEAFELINKAVALSPDNPFYLDSLGWAYYRLGNLDKAVALLKKAINIRDDVDFLAHLGEVLWMQNKHDEARKIWRRAIAKDDKNSLLLHTIRRFGL